MPALKVQCRAAVVGGCGGYIHVGMWGRVSTVQDSERATVWNNEASLINALDRLARVHHREIPQYSIESTIVGV